MFRKSPGFTLAALAALTLGIGANTAIFSVVDAVMLRPVAFPDADRLVMLEAKSPQGANTAGSPAKFAWWHAQTDAVQDVSAFRTNVVNDTGNGTPGADSRRAGVGRLFPALWCVAPCAADRSVRTRIARAPRQWSC